MERLLFTISPAYNGWQVRDELRNRDWFALRQDAVVAADTLAYARHTLTGTPTGVLIDNRDGEPVLCAQHG